MNYVNHIFSNRIIIACFISWFMAQGIKIVIDLVVTGKFDFGRIMGSGGMPSSHSALVSCLVISTAKYSDVGSPVFAVALILAFIVMYDASNVRRAAGEQAKILNYMMNHWKEMKPEIFSRELKELLGHTPFQVFVGAILGIIIGIFY